MAATAPPTTIVRVKLGSLAVRRGAVSATTTRSSTGANVTATATPGSILDLAMPIAARAPAAVASGNTTRGRHRRARRRRSHWRIRAAVTSTARQHAGTKRLRGDAIPGSSSMATAVSAAPSTVGPIVPIRTMAGGQVLATIAPQAPTSAAAAGATGSSASTATTSRPALLIAGHEGRGGVGSLDRADAGHEDQRDERRSDGIQRLAFRQDGANPHQRHGGRRSQASGVGDPGWAPRPLRPRTGDHGDRTGQDDSPNHWLTGSREQRPGRERDGEHEAAVGRSALRAPAAGLAAALEPSRLERTTPRPWHGDVAHPRGHDEGDDPPSHAGDVRT